MLRTVGPLIASVVLVASATAQCNRTRLEG